MPKNKEQSKTSEPAVVAAGEQEDETVKALEDMAASEDVEFKKYENLYFDAKKSLGEFFDHVGKVNLENYKKGTEKDLFDELAELKNLLKSKNYENFKNNYTIFDNKLKSLYSDIDRKSKEEKNKPVAVKTEEQEEKDREERSSLYDKRDQDFVLLVDIIERVDKNEGEKRKLVRNYKEKMKPLEVFLDDASGALYETKDSEVFLKNINDFDNGFKTLIADLEPDIKELYNLGEVPKEEKPVAVVTTSETKSVVAGEIKNVKPTVEKKEPASNIEISKSLLPEAVAATAAAKPAEKVLAEETAPPEPAPKKKGLWKRFREGVKGVFNRETGKALGKVTYKSIASVLGLKIVSDFVLWKTTGTGDMADWARGRKESKQSLESIAAAQKSMMELFDQAQNNKTLAETEKTKERIADFKKQLESPGLPPEIKQVIAEKLKAFEEENQEKMEQAKIERDEEVRRVMETYEERKVSGITIARDAMNFALTASGFFMLRGLMYAGVAVVERIKKAKKKHTKEAAEKKFSYKDVMVDAAIETAHGLSVGLFSKEKLGAKRRTINLIKSLGTVARAFGIGGLIFSHAEAPAQSVGKLLAGFKEQGVAKTLLWNNFAQNAHHVYENAERVEHGVEKVLHAATNPVESAYNGVVSLEHVGQPEHAPAAETHEAIVTPEHHETPAIPEQPSVPEHHEVPVVPTETPAEFSVDQFAVDHQLSPEFAHSLDNLVHQYPELNNQESVQHILGASRVGGGAHSHHEIIKSKIDTLDESGGERRQVIFEELKQKGSPESAANYLQSQNFSSQHLSHLPAKYVHDGKLDYAKFVQDYNEKDNKMVRGLFGAMQGKESTTLANAGLEGDGVDSHVHGKVNYFGIGEDKKPILSGSGEVRVVEESFVTRNKVGNAAAQNEGLSTDDKLWANANVIRSMSGGPAYDGSSANAPAESLSAEEQAVLAEVEGDKERFARLGERHIDILDTAHSGKPVGEYINDTVQPEAPGAEPVPAATESVAVSKVINTYKSSQPGTVVEAKPVVLPVESKAVVPVVEKPLPEKASVELEPYADAPINQFLKEHGSNQKEFFDDLLEMRNKMSARLDSSLLYTEESGKFVDDKLVALYGVRENYRSTLEHGLKLSSADSKQMEKLLHAQELYKNGESGWEESLDKAIFSKDDSKVMSLGFLAHKNPESNPILTNGSHAVRIWSAAEKKDFFWYQPGLTFNFDEENGVLIIKGSAGEQIMSKEDVLKKVN